MTSSRVLLSPPGTFCFTTNNSWSTSSSLHRRSLRRRRGMTQGLVAWKKVTGVMRRAWKQKHKPTWITLKVATLTLNMEPPLLHTNLVPPYDIQERTVCCAGWCKSARTKQNARNLDDGIFHFSLEFRGWRRTKAAVIICCMKDCRIRLYLISDSRGIAPYPYFFSLFQIDRRAEGYFKP